MEREKLGLTTVSEITPQIANPPNLEEERGVIITNVDIKTYNQFLMEEFVLITHDKVHADGRVDVCGKPGNHLFWNRLNELFV